MKLKLSHHHDISILDVLEDVRVEKAPALRAGIVQLFRSGKNRIILDLHRTTALPQEALKEIINLHRVATELKGSIVLVGKGDQVRRAIESFAVPPPLKYFPTVKAALASFEDEVGQDEVKKAEPNKDKGRDETREELLLQVKHLEQVRTALLGQLKNRDPEETRRLRAENTELRHALDVLKKQVLHLLKERKTPVDEPALQTRIRELEDTLSRYLPAKTRPTP